MLKKSKSYQINILLPATPTVWAPLVGDTGSRLFLRLLSGRPAVGGMRSRLHLGWPSIALVSSYWEYALLSAFGAAL